jgi:carboxyl-terminal processing protease
VVQVKEPGDSVQTYDDEDPDVYWRRPMVVVCNRFSASASEIFAGAIKDYRRGIVVGDRTTHGKGTVQNVVPVAGRMSLFAADRGALKLTISKFYRVNGDSTQTRGVVSDVVLPSLLNHRDIGEESMDNALEFDRITRAPYNQYPNVTDALVESLQKKSDARVETDEDFVQINKLIARYLERKNEKSISLNESVLRAEEEELKQERKEEEEAIKQTTGSANEDIFPKDFYNEELVNISIDYLQLLSSQQAAKN